MKEEINFCDFTDRFRDMGRKENFSYNGLKALFDYFEELEESCDITINFDCIAICCEYSEYEDIKDFNSEYGKEYKTIEDIREETEVIDIEETEGFIVRCF